MCKTKLKQNSLVNGSEALASTPGSQCQTESAEPTEFCSYCQSQRPGAREGGEHSFLIYSQEAGHQAMLSITESP